MLLPITGVKKLFLHYYDDTMLTQSARTTYVFSKSTQDESCVPVSLPVTI